MRSRLWVYTSRTDVIYASPRRDVQDRYARLIEAGKTRYHRIVFALEYLLQETDFSSHVDTLGRIYLLPVSVLIPLRGHKGTMMVLRADRCSLGSISVVIAREPLDYKDVQRLLEEYNVTLVRIAPRGLKIVIDYERLRSIVKSGAIDAYAGMGESLFEHKLLEVLGGELLVSIEDVEKMCPGAF